jgi:hypothetical protein
MSTSRPFAYNVGDPIDGTDQVGDLAIGTDFTQPYATNYGGVQWWSGPDEELGYVICKPIVSGNQPNPLGIPCYIGFERSDDLTDQSFLDLANVVFPGNNFPTAAGAKSWMDTNGYWTSYAGGTGGTGAGWEFYYAEGALGSTPPPLNDGEVIFIYSTAQTITYNPNYSGSGGFQILFNENQLDGSSSLSAFNTLDSSGGTVAMSQGANTAIYSGGVGVYFVQNFGASNALVINAQVATLVQAASAPFVSGTPITLTIS